MTEQKIQKREIYLQKIKKYIWSPIIKVITGMRRSGKSYFLQSILQEFVAEKIIKDSNIFYINKELLKFDFIKNYDDLNKNFTDWKSNISWKFVVAIDEIQEIQMREKFINSILAEYQNDVEIFITWSNSNLLSSKLSTHIAGRYAEFIIYPLSLLEFAQFEDCDITEELFLDYIKYGSLPWIFNLRKNDEVIYDYLRWVYNTIFVKDILNYNKINSNHFFVTLYEYIFKNIWTTFTANSIQKYLKSQKINIWVDTILNYIQYGVESYLLQSFKKHDIKGKKTFQIYEKYFINDLGIRNSIVWFDFGRDIANILENIVFLELKRRWYEVFLGQYKNREIDFVAKKWWDYEYFQVTYLLQNEETIQREFRWLLDIKDNRPKTVLSMDKTFANKHEWVNHINIIERLSK